MGLALDHDIRRAFIGVYLSLFLQGDGQGAGPDGSPVHR